MRTMRAAGPTRSVPRAGATLALAALLCLLAACSSEPKVSGAVPSQKQMTDAATSPLSDLNIVKAPIPEVLARARKAPYALPADHSCAALAIEVGELEAALGADLDAPASASNPGLIDRGVEKGADAAGEALVGAVRRTTEGLIPYRSWIRKLSGAERYSHEVSAAIAAGSVRRAYLKGVGSAQGCEPPAAPRGAATP